MRGVVDSVAHNGYAVPVALEFVHGVDLVRRQLAGAQVADAHRVGYVACGGVVVAGE